MTLKSEMKTVFARIAAATFFVTATLTLPHTSMAQSGAGAAPAALPAIPASTGTYSIESEILAYKALRANGTQIAGEVNNLRRDGNLILIPSTSTAVPAFQLWRAHMLIVYNFLKQTRSLLQGGDGCPTATQPGQSPPSFAGYSTAIGEGVSTLQSILSLFANSQSINEFTGTIQDQALILTVARDLRKKGATVLTPDIYGPSTIATLGPVYPFVSILGTLIDQHAALQKAYVCNAVAATAAGQIQQAEIARETDYAKLAKLGAGDDAKVQPIVDDIAMQKGILTFLRLRIGLSADDLMNIDMAEADIDMQGQTVGTLTAAGRGNALQAIHSDDVSVSNRELPQITRINLKVAQIMGLVTGIETYLATLTGGSITLTPPAAPSAPSASQTTTQGSTQTGGQQQGGGPGAQTGSATTGNGTGTGSPAGPAPAQPNPSSSSSAPTIVAILQADGLAARMGFTLGADSSVSAAQLDQWKMVWLKALESGGAIINEATIFGSHPYFGGGAISGYALYQLDGTLICSANVASYGGYVKAKKFPDFAAIDQTVRSIVIGGSCADDQP